MKCPQCGGECERDEVDNGVGMQACSPWGCPVCHWVDEDVPAIEIVLVKTRVEAVPGSPKTIPLPDGWPKHVSEVEHTRQVSTDFFTEEE